MPLLFLAVLLDLIGFGIILPLLPLYAREYGASGLDIGLLVTSYSVIQLFMAPLWGRLSDRVGRKPILVLGLFGSAIAYVIFALSGSLLALLASRVVAGVGGSTIPIAQAYVADITPPEERAGRMGIIGAAFGLGFIIGPAMGGVASSRGYAVPGFLAAAICATGGIVALFLLRESFPKERRVANRKAPSQWIPYHGLREAWGSRQMTSILGAYLLLTMAFATIQPTLSLLARERFDLATQDVGYLFALLGTVTVFVQGGLVRRLAPKWGERQLLIGSAVPFAAGLALMGLSQDLTQLRIGLCLLGIGYGGTIPCALALISRAGSWEHQGTTLGLGQSVGSMGRILGPALAGALFDFGAGFPYVAGAGLVLGSALVAQGLTQPTGDPPGTNDRRQEAL